MHNLRKSVTVLAALAAGFTTAGCGGEPAPAEAPRAASARVALTIAPEGAGARLALITFQAADGRPCHALGTLTTAGPRVLDALDEPLDLALAGRGHCLRDGSVSLATAQAAGGQIRVIGGLASKGVRRVVIGGERVRPSRSGAFLVAQRAGGPPAGDVELIYAGGGSERVPLDRLTGADVRD